MKLWFRAVFRALTGLLLPALAIAGDAAALPNQMGAAPIELLRDWDARARVTHRVILDQPQTQTITIETVLRGVNERPVDFSLPAWRPGRYQILNPAGEVSQVRCVALDGAQLPVEQVDKDTWRVHARDAAIKLVYRVYANELERRTRHVDHSHAFLSGAAVFMLVPPLRNEPQRLVISVQPEWRVTTGLDAWTPQPHTFLAASYDALIDAPLEIGAHETHEFKVGGKRHQLAIWGAAPPPEDLTRLTADLTRLAEAQEAFWGDAPYGRFVWLLHLTSGAGGGTEHFNSTIMQVGRDALQPGRNYRRLIDLASHEYFHVWNVKRLRPAGLSPYDLERENYSDLLWVAEGTTDYYTTLLLVRAGVLSPQQYFKDLGQTIDRWRSRPGRGVQSVAQASFNAWTQMNAGSPNDDNATVSIYREGQIVSLALDLTLRLRSDGKASLDDVLRSLYSKFPLGGGGYTSADLEAAANEVAGADMSDFFADHVRATLEPPLEILLDEVGLELTCGAASDSSPASSPASAPASATADADDDERGKNVPYIGLELVERDGLARVRRVLADGPAFAAGVQVDDAVITLDGRRLTAAALGDRLRARRPGDEVRLLVLRRDMEHVIHVPLDPPPAGEHKLSPTNKPSARQKRNYERWLGRVWEAP